MLTGEKTVDVKYQDKGFPRKIGYAQQLDLHLCNATVREALIFSARLRQAQNVPDTEKLAYVEDVIQDLDMSGFADAVIGTAGQGLNVEQRKRVTIGVELAAKPELLLFLDEPTSGLDSNTAWSICQLLRKLADKGQAILCTVHQPSAAMFQVFDRLLFLKEGKSIYFGEIGANFHTLISYFESNGARSCQERENPAEWLFSITDDEAEQNEKDWPSIWSASEDRQRVKGALVEMRQALSKPMKSTGKMTSNEFASPFLYQLLRVSERNLIRDWRTPYYLYSKLFLTIGAVSPSHYFPYQNY